MTRWRAPAPGEQEAGERSWEIIRNAYDERLPRPRARDWRPVVGVAIGVPTPASDPWQAVGDLMMLGAGATWAATTLVVKSSALTRTPAGSRKRTSRLVG